MTLRDEAHCSVFKTVTAIMISVCFGVCILVCLDNSKQLRHLNFTRRENGKKLANLYLYFMFLN